MLSATNKHIKIVLQHDCFIAVFLAKYQMVIFRMKKKLLVQTVVFKKIIDNKTEVVFINLSLKKLMSR